MGNLSRLNREGDKEGDSVRKFFFVEFFFFSGN